MIRIVRMTFMEEFVASFEKLFDERKDKIRQVEGCQHLQLWRDQNNSNIFYTYSIWEHESYLEQYRKSYLFENTWALVKVWFAEKPIAFSTNKLLEVS